MGRKAGTWITNVHQGGLPMPCEPTPEMRELASRALAAVDADYAGVDLIAAPDGRLMVLEVNSNPSWRGLQSVSDVDVAEAIVEDFLAAVADHQRVRRCPA
jgi:glutathione synthase/RimK-type ligase-like ATP-grasp enzyme